MTKPRKASKPEKVEEPAAIYGAPPSPIPKRTSSKAAKVSSQATDEAEIQRLTDKIFTEQKELLRKLAQ